MKMKMMNRRTMTMINQIKNLKATRKMGRKQRMLGA
jgi:hypothetical protein